MGGPEKPFSCPETGCGASFTNEDRLAVHSRKHDMVLQLGSKGGSFVADQTPTPTRFIRNCEEVGLFQDLQNVNPFDETFKRAMESRTEISHLTLNSNLSVVSTDDTLHTPHIFPHIHEDNSNNQYVCKSDHQASNNTNKISDENCSSTDNENNSHDSNSQNKNSSDKSIKKYPRLKLIRQNSVDIIENDHNSIIIERIDSNSIDDKNEKDKSINTSDNLDKLNIPIINISDSSEKSDTNETMQNADNRKVISHNSKNSILLDTPDLEKINMKILYKKSLELMSQTSIEMALVNFANEVNDRHMDLHNISIEDIPSPNVDREISSTKVSIHPSNKQNSIETPMDQMKNNELPQDEKLDNTEKSIISDVDQIDPIIVDNTNENQSNNESNKGYELLLKWPDGKKVYLKEVFREDDLQKDPSSIKNINIVNKMQDQNEHSKENTLSMSGVKRKLKESLESSTKRISTNQLPSSITSNNLSSDVLIPHAFIVQKSSDVPFTTNNIISKSDSQVLIKTGKINPSVIKIQSNSTPDFLFNLDTTNDLEKRKKNYMPTLIPKISNIKPNNRILTANDILPNPTYISTNLNKSADKAVILTNKNTKQILKTTRNVVKSTKLSEKDVYDQKKVEIQERNRAAVNRYRTRKKAQNTLISQKNQKLEAENKELKQKLYKAVQEIKRLNDILSSHVSCTIKNI